MLEGIMYISLTILGARTADSEPLSWRLGCRQLSSGPREPSRQC